MFGPINPLPRLSFPHPKFGAITHSPSPPLSDFEILGSRSLADIAGGDLVVVVVVDGGTERRIESILRGPFNVF